MHCIDLNVWYSRIDKPPRPDFVVFDLDPPDGGFRDAIRVAHLVRELMAEVELASYVKTSGADGIHVLVPITRRRGLRRRLRVRRGGGAAARAPSSGARHDRVAEAEAAGRPRRSPAERLGEDDRDRVLGPAEPGCSGLDAARLGRADGGDRAARLHDGHHARPGRAPRRPLRARPAGRPVARAGAPRALRGSTTSPSCRSRRVAIRLAWTPASHADAGRP